MTWHMVVLQKTFNDDQLCTWLINSVDKMVEGQVTNCEKHELNLVFCIINMSILIFLYKIGIVFQTNNNDQLCVYVAIYTLLSHPQENLFQQEFLTQHYCWYKRHHIVRRSLVHQ